MVSNQQKVYDCNIPNFKVAIFTGDVSSPFPINRRVLPVEDMYNVIKKVHPTGVILAVMVYTKHFLRNITV